jgi:hypothetical protein
MDSGRTSQRKKAHRKAKGKARDREDDELWSNTTKLLNTKHWCA